MFQDYSLLILRLFQPYSKLIPRVFQTFLIVFQTFKLFQGFFRDLFQTFKIMPRYSQRGKIFARYTVFQIHLFYLLFFFIVPILNLYFSYPIDILVYFLSTSQVIFICCFTFSDSFLFFYLCTFLAYVLLTFYTQMGNLLPFQCLGIVFICLRGCFLL